MKIYKDILKSILVALVVFTTSCTSDFEDINTDKDKPTTSTSGTLLPSVIFEPLNAHIDVQLFLTNHIMQYWVWRNDNHQIDEYDFASGKGKFDVLWSKIYRALIDSNESIAYAEANNLDAYVAAGKIMNAFYIATLTEMWIDVPFSEASKGLDNSQPAYDKQELIYPQVLALLKEANTLLANDTEGFVLDGDVLFGGDVMKWRRMANSLRLRYLLRLSNQSSVNAESEINTIVSDPTTYPIITSNSEAAIYDFSGVAPNTSGFSQISATRIDGLSPSQRFVSTLDGVDSTDDADDDPRLAFFAEKPIAVPTTGPYLFLGVKNGTTREEAQGTGGNAEINASFFTNKFQDNPGLLDFTFIGYSEVQFILAEARLNNWITAGTAQQYYENGITANLDYWDITTPAGFLSREDVAWDNTLDTLINQKWIALFFNNTIATWGDYKRLGLPAYDIGPLATTVTSGKVPTRVFYPTLEQSVNSANYSAAASSIGGDIITAPHWYQ